MDSEVVKVTAIPEIRELKEAFRTMIFVLRRNKLLDDIDEKFLTSKLKL